ncbi:hypothetical protein GCM10023144_19020 [Pigmentiphaga soli]|uniref:Haloacid dehalogenase n=1 Tax=Pigmentiphaga soli TaxID=1007095 RepID=A0ABP8GWR7_9BURK
MSIEAVVTNFDHLLEQIDEAPESRQAAEQRRTIERFLRGAQHEGYLLGLITGLSAERLGSVLDRHFGADSLDYFSVIVAGAADPAGPAGQEPYDVALRTLGVPPERCAAVGSTESELPAGPLGFAACVPLPMAMEAICADYAE